MTTFIEFEVRFGVVVDSDFFLGGSAWEARHPLAGDPLRLSSEWSAHFLPVLAPRLPSGFSHACMQRMREASRIGGQCGFAALVVAESRWPEGFLALGGYESLLGFLKDVLESDYPKVTPADYCAAICVVDDDPAGLSYLSEPPGANEIAEARRELDALATLAARLDAGRAWGLYVGDMDDCWRGSSLAESQRGFARSSLPAARAATPTSDGVDVDQLLAQAEVYLRYGKRDHAVTHLRTILANAPRHERARTLLAGLALRNESM